MLVCGFETVNIINPATLKYVFYKDTGNHKPIDVKTLFASSESNCPVLFYKLYEI